MVRLTVVILVAVALALSGCVDDTDDQDVEMNDSVDDSPDEDAGDGDEGDRDGSGETDGDEDDGAGESDAEDGESGGEAVSRVDGEGYTEFSGSVSASTETVELDEGLVKLSIENRDAGEEDGVFYLDVVDSEGGVVEEVVRSQGNWSGSALLHLQRGSYALDVRSQGNWSVTVDTELGEAMGEPDVDASGSHGRVFGPFDYVETVEVTLEVRDDEHAVVDLYGPEGRFDSMLNMVGPAEDTMVYSDSRTHYVYLDTDSEDWNIRVQAAE